MATVHVLTSPTHHPRTAALVTDLLALIPHSAPLPDTATPTPGSVTISFTEDFGPQFISIRSPAKQVVFKLIEFKSRRDMGIPEDEITKQESQLVLTNFETDLGAEIADFLMLLFPINIDSNQVINFSVHKDFIFFRMYRFTIRQAGPAMRPIGPHLTLRLWRVTEYDGDDMRTREYKKYVKGLNLLGSARMGGES